METRSRTEHCTGEVLMFGFALAFARYIEKESSWEHNSGTPAVCGAPD